MRQRQILTPKQAAEELGIRDGIIYNALRSGALAGFRPTPQRWRIRREDLEAWAGGSIGTSHEDDTPSGTTEPNIVEVVLDGKRKAMGPQHEKFPLLLQALAARLDTFLVGPAGTGKTAGAVKAAGALGLPVYNMSLGPATMGYDLFGFVNANGEHVRGAIRDAFETGGIMVLDEMDVASPEALTMLNTALANGFATFPDGARVVRHQDCVFVATGNTFGKGGDWQYKRGEGLDAATLDRFGTIYWGVDTSFETALVQGFAEDYPDSAIWMLGWLAYVQRARRAAERGRSQQVISYRAIERGIRMHLQGVEDDTAVTAFALSADIPDEEWNEIVNRAGLERAYDSNTSSDAIAAAARAAARAG